MKAKKIILRTVSLAVLFIIHANSYAQCAMCRSTVQSNLDNGGSIGKELNTGILYLMAIPYLIIMTGGYFFFKKPIDAKIKAWKEKHFPRKQAS